MRGRRPEKSAARGLTIALVLTLAPGCASHILLGAFDEQEGGTGDGRPDAGAVADSGTVPDAGPDGGPLGDAGLPPDGTTGDPCADYAAELCALEQSCNLTVFRNAFWGDPTICKERRKIRCTLRLTAPGSNETPARVSACVAALSKYTCDDYADEAKTREICDAPPGNLGDGAPCGVGAQCRGQGCFPPDNAACGVCTTLSPLGAPCNASCQYGIQCLNSTCVAYLREGDACRFGSPLCAFGLACLGAGSGQGKCGKRLGLGAPCDPSAFECNDGEGLSCSGATNRCQADPGLPAAGAPCWGQSCRADAWCNTANSRCEAKRREGEPCGNSASAPECLQPATCIGTTCVLPNPSGCR
jgi:hypothetical protein